MLRAMSRPRWAAGAALFIALASRAAFAQDPPPPMIPGDVARPPAGAAARPFAGRPAPGAAPGALALAGDSAAGDASPEAAPAEPPPPPEPLTSRDRRRGAAARSINGYAFPTPLLIDSAFVTTHVGLGRRGRARLGLRRGSPVHDGEHA